MRNRLRRLLQISEQPVRRILGLMSGTSLDGLDLALCEVTGSGVETKIKLTHFTTLHYDAFYRQQIADVFAKRQVDLQQVCLLNAWIGKLHGEMVNSTIAKWGLDPVDIDMIASHGQTVFHAPISSHQLKDMPNATLQLGDGDHIAMTTGIITLSDFRQKHIAAGGEGAPLVQYGDFLLCSSTDKNRLLLNIGGIANFTYIPRNARFDAVISSDLGPGNTLMDQVIRQAMVGYQGSKLSFDQDAKLAQQGSVNSDLIRELKAHRFFAQLLPKTTGPELFNLHFLAEAQRRSDTMEMGLEDMLATLNAFTAECIVEGIQQLPVAPKQLEVFISGGGVHNPLLMHNIETRLPETDIFSSADLGISPDAKEAMLFALLANESVAGDPDTFANDSALPAVSLGKLSFPD